MATGASGPVVKAEHLTKRFGNETAVDDVSFEIPRGAIFGYIGPSGSGKTTTIRMLTGVYLPTSGSVSVLGAEPQEFGRSVRERIGYMPQHFVLYPDLTVWENLQFSASVYGMGRRGRRIRELLEFVELEEHRSKQAKNISGGMQRRLSLAVSLLHNPQLVFLDEPTAGIDPVLRRKFWDRFRELQSEGTTLFITTQYVGETVYCDLVGVMAEDGRLVALDTPDALRRQAFGGEMVVINLVEAVEPQMLRELRGMDFVTGQVRREGETGVHLVVDDAATAIPRVLDWGRAGGLQIDSAEEYDPPFDDVFVEIMNRSTDRQSGGQS